MATPKHTNTRWNTQPTPRKVSRKGILTTQYNDDSRDIDTTSEEHKIAHRKFYDSKQWKSLRSLTLRAHPLCRRCKSINRLQSAQMVDHLLQWKDKHDPLATNLDNMYSLCNSCHGAISKLENREGNRWRMMYYNGTPLKEIAPLKYTRKEYKQFNTDGGLIGWS